MDTNKKLYKKSLDNQGIFFYITGIEKEELKMKDYTELLKKCETFEDVKNLEKDFWNEEKAFGIETIKAKRNINNFFRSKNPNKIEYICDGDTFLRRCQIKNLHRFIKFIIK